MSVFLRPLMCLVIAGAVLNNTALAGDTVSLSVTGNVLAAPCDIRSDSVTKTVDLGDGAPVQAGLLQTPGSATKWIPFTLGLVNCPAGTTKATIEFSGKPDAVNPEDLYENTGTAGNIAIQLQGAGGEPFGNGKRFTGDIAAGSYTYNLRARVYSETGKVTAGTIRAAVTTTFTYQ
ncbi:fimbrial protein [Morganella morganii]|uniref:fimbrial protein n=1 Tax=Morganella morganii TaxID=582 RepID=UPI0034D39C1D